MERQMVFVRHRRWKVADSVSTSKATSICCVPQVPLPPDPLPLPNHLTPPWYWYTYALQRFSNCI